MGSKRYVGALLIILSFWWFNYWPFLGVGAVVLALAVAVKLGGVGCVAVPPTSCIVQFQNQSDASVKRWVPLDSKNGGGFNLRDLGGLRCADGRTVKRGLVFRSSAPRPKDVPTLQKLGVRTVIDLRSSSERSKKPCQFPASIKSVHSPVYDVATWSNTLMFWLAVLFRRAWLATFLLRLYVFFLDTGARALGSVLQHAKHGQPVMFHCAAGKDRTGLAAALLLSCLGVPDETIVAEFTLSNAAPHGCYEHLMRWSRKAVAHPAFRFLMKADELQGFMLVHADHIRASLAHIRDTYGGVETYLTKRAGMSAEDIRLLRETLLE